MSTPRKPGPAGKIKSLAFSRRIYYGPRAVCIFSFPDSIPSIPGFPRGYPT